MRWVIVVIFVACSQPPAAPQLPSNTGASTGLTALRASQFAKAEAEASAFLARDSRSAQAAAARAIAAYQRAGMALVSDLDTVSREGDGLSFFDHERARTAWRTFADALAAVDKDLAVVAADPSFSLELCLACWDVDWNRNGQIDERDRKMLEIEYDGKGGSLDAGDPRRRPTFRFDVGDALWGRAMISFQRALVELVLAYRWSELDAVFLHQSDRMVIHLVDPGRVKRARELVLAGLAFSDAERAAYLAETDDDREFVPNPHQKSHPIPLDVDNALYATWAGVTGDVRQLLASETGISIRELGGFVSRDFARWLPDAYIDLGAMLRDPTDIILQRMKGPDTPELYERILRGWLGHGYAQRMRASALVARVRHTMDDVDHGEDTLDRKLHYLFWLN